METKGKASLYQVMLAGAAGGFANSIILCPVDQLKVLAMDSTCIMRKCIRLRCKSIDRKRWCRLHKG